jgi:hypothetical protein
MSEKKAFPLRIERHIDSEGAPCGLTEQIVSDLSRRYAESLVIENPRKRSWSAPIILLGVEGNVSKNHLAVVRSRRRGCASAEHDAGEGNYGQQSNFHLYPM